MADHRFQSPDKGFSETPLTHCIVDECEMDEAEEQRIEVLDWIEKSN